MKKIVRLAIAIGLVFVLCFASQIQAGSILLEQGNYAEETLGDLDKAISIYEKIINDSQAGRDDVSEALFRLGLCQLKKGNRVEAVVPLKKLVRNYPEQSRFSGKARALLAIFQAEMNTEIIDGDLDSAFVAKALPNTDQPKNAYVSNRAVKNQNSFSKRSIVTWPSGQIQKWRVSHAPNTPSSYKAILRSANVATIKGKKYWCFETLDRLNKYYSRVFVDMVTHRPVFSYIKTGIRTIEVKYGAEKIELRSNHQGSNRTKSFPVKGPVFDSLQLGFYSNPGPLTVGYLKIGQVFAAHLEALYEFRLNVIGTEIVIVPAGTFDCHKVIVEVRYVNRWINTDIELWVSIKEKTVVKRIIDFDTHELVETTIKPTSISSFQESALESLFNKNSLESRLKKISNLSKHYNEK